MKIFLFIVAAFCSFQSLIANVDIVCTPELCQNMDCKAAELEVLQCDGRIDAHGGFCGCCPACIKQLGEGEKCFTGLLGVANKAECGPGLMCHPSRKQCVKQETLIKGQCHLDALEKQQQMHPGIIGGVHIPECLEDGSYAPVQCIESVCLCVDRDGKQIGDYEANVGRRNEMNCQCARGQDAYGKTGMLGKIFNCNELGNYEAVQCVGSVCHCVDKVGNMLQSVKPVPISEVSTLDCERARKMQAGPCALELQKLQQGPQVIGVFKPACRNDGTYQPRQCHGSVCYCVDNEGQSTGLEAPIAMASKMTCRCAHEEANYLKSGLLGKMYNCDELGNYEAIQCLGSMCYCVNSQGKQLSGMEPVSIGDSSKLKCAPVRRIATRAVEQGLCARELEKLQNGGSERFGAYRPTCLEDGSYHPRQCIGSVCKCVDSEGKPTGVSAGIWQARFMSCQCDHDKADYFKTGLIGKLFYCDELGNYKNEIATRDIAVKGPCALELEKLEKNPQLMGSWKPQCLPDGTYHPRQCHEAVCMCVDSQGKPTGEKASVGKSQVMNCQCGRDKADYTKSGQFGKIFSCDQLGNYGPIQCEGSMCQCVDSLGQKLEAVKPVPIAEVYKLVCPKTGRIPVVSGPCHKEALEKTENMQPGMIGVHIPDCLEDGYYAPVQCFESVCTCVDRVGKQIDNYQANVGRRHEMNCQCARGQDEYAKTGMTGLSFSCDEIGNYNPVQCVGSMCHCVDFVGNMIDSVKPVPIGEIAKLHCDLARRDQIGACALHLQRLGDDPDSEGWLPSCLNDGSYNPRQCRGDFCWCVDKEGSFTGTAMMTTKSTKMTCKCAFDEAEYVKTGMLGRTFNCDEMGNYNPVQCLGSMCYCVNSQGKVLSGMQPVPIGQSATIKCGSSGRSLEARQVVEQGSCARELAKLEQGPQLIGSWKPQCLPDGSYHPRQCREAICMCVDSQGKPTGEKASVGKALQMTCQCSRDKADYMNTGMLGKTFSCDQLGNYGPIQCLGSICQCVDTVGNQLEMVQPVPIAEIHKLVCPKTGRQPVVDGPCAQEVLEKTENMQPGIIGVFIPECLDDGFYAPVQCIGSVCSCVDRHGKQIGDYQANIGKRTEMTCQCARSQDEYAKTGMLGMVFSCDELGNFQPIQCVGSMCHCVDSLGNMVEAIKPVPIADISALNCENSIRKRPPGPCAAELIELKKQPQAIGAWKPTCRNDGSYNPRQCRGSVCFCVDKDGKATGTEAPIGMSSKMTCKCANDEANYLKSGLLGKMFNCDELGNYNDVQCVGSMCFCVNSQGKQLTGIEAVPIGESSSLKCGPGKRMAQLGPCAQELAKLEQRPPLIGGYKPQCLPDGSYHPRQCREAICMCVDSQGKPTGEKASVGKALQMTCQCAHDKADYTNTGMLGKTFSCDQLGNYGPIQCLGSICQCVDTVGNQLEMVEPVPIAEIHKLVCPKTGRQPVVDGPCAQDVLEKTENMQPGIIGVFIPECLDDGFYAPVQCVGSVCSCVDRHGKELGDYKANIGRRNEMTCQCARSQDEYAKTGMLGMVFSCDELGNFQPIQCVGSMCHCVDSLGNMVEAIKPVPIADISALNCENSIRKRPPGPCAAELIELKKQPQLIGAWKPTCRNDGSYNPRQCRGSVCFCVDKDGKATGTEAPIGMSSKMTCKCANDEANYLKSGLLGKMFNCDELGNYNPVQCVGSMCFCVNSQGKQLTGVEAVTIGESSTLKCTTRQMGTRSVEQGACVRELQMLQERPPAFGAFKPDCMEDGSYNPRQCHGSVCYCVDDAGRKIPGYDTPIGQSRDQNCKCARKANKTGMVGIIITCDEMGNFDKIQCIGSVCHCVNENGNMLQGSQMVSIGQISKLKC